jgi:hypothetical protein
MHSIHTSFMPLQPAPNQARNYLGAKKPKKKIIIIVLFG